MSSGSQALFGRSISIFITSLAVQVVLAADCPVGNDVVEVGLVLGHAPDALTSFDRDLATHRQIVHVLPRAERLHEENRKQAGRLF